MQKSNSKFAVLPVMFGFFIMGFVDIVGVATSYVKADFAGMDDKVSGLISLSCFLWFLILSIPTGMLMNRIGRKKTVVVSFAITALAMLIPVLKYDFAFVLVAFAMLGIGNTMLQVALNPLVTNVVSAEKLTGTITLGQFIKAMSSFLGPILAAMFAGSVWGWKAIFPVYAAVTVLAMAWLAVSPIQEQLIEKSEITFARTFSLLRDKYIVLFFIGILVLVGVDVGMGVTFPKLLQERCSLPLEKAGMGNSVYFLARTVGAFLGGVVLMRFSASKFFTASSCLALVSLVGLIFSRNLTMILFFVALFGLGYANLFSIIFSLSMQKMPQKTNEVSALLIVGVSGGAVLPPLLGVITDTFGTQGSALITLAIVWVYMVALIPFVRNVRPSGNEN
ncbi:MAG: MFS transporter [Candidatus Cryptobacteroides sp.]|jgi:FHS family L-fucose permease-like MFS transporter|uniref:MFS transporter n=1 Tax=Candidatus Cryptobacteroides bacterium TaxID=3085639 RepID=UPI00033FAB50|nr:MFS transporter [Bacteroidales bacterium]MCI6045064.1 MFS transporter [Alistipes sp.]MDY4725895.1 MFS transporter [Candidatus Cryptobacteroides sp.]CCX51454.1 putative glucose/galactose transporter [Alistipes sp. CAG:514]MDY5198530.1 MFS transporter [Candidatus Cryptobacteroides sp.]